MTGIGSIWRNEAWERTRAVDPWRRPPSRTPEARVVITVLPEPSPTLVALFVTLPLLVAGALPALVYRAERRLRRTEARARRTAWRTALAAAAWMAVTGAIAASGQLSFERTPPTGMLIFPVVGALGLGIGLSGIGRRLAALPVATLVALQAFRLPLELAMHQAYVEGLMPVQMSYSGRNLDIVTGASALLLAPLVARGLAPRWAVSAWNAMGIVLLANVLVIAALSTPTALRAFHDAPAMVWVTRFPFVWLPAVLVVTAIYGHVVVFRALARESRRESARVSDPITA